MATEHYRAYMDRRGVVKTARKLCESLQCDTFVTATANNKYLTWSADFPGDRPLPGYTVVETFRYVPPLPGSVHRHYELIYLLEHLDYEVNHNPSPNGDGAATADQLASLIREALDLGLLEIVRGTP